MSDQNEIALEKALTESEAEIDRLRAKVAALEEELEEKKGYIIECDDEARKLHEVVEAARPFEDFGVNEYGQIRLGSGTNVQCAATNIKRALAKLDREVEP